MRQWLVIIQNHCKDSVKFFNKIFPYCLKLNRPHFTEPWTFSNSQDAIQLKIHKMTATS